MCYRTVIFPKIPIALHFHSEGPAGALCPHSQVHHIKANENTKQMIDRRQSSRSHFIITACPVAAGSCKIKRLLQADPPGGAALMGGNNASSQACAQVLLWKGNKRRGSGEHVR